MTNQGNVNVNLNVISHSSTLPPLDNEGNEWQLKALEKADNTPKTNGPQTEK